MNTGIKNEIEFIKYLNNKPFSEMHPIMQDFLNDLYKFNLEKTIVHAYKGMYFEKADIIIIIKNVKKFISIKIGDKNSVHAEKLEKFILFLKKEGFSGTDINSYLYYHYGDYTIDGNGKERLSVEQLKKRNPKMFESLNLKLLELNFDNVLNRFLLNGNLKHNYRQVDALIYGCPNDFLWANSKELKHYFFSKMSFISSGIHYSLFSIQPMARCLNYNPKYENYRDVVQIKWFNMFDSILEITFIREYGISLQAFYGGESRQYKN